MFAEAFKTDNKIILENRAKFVGVHVSSGHKQALKGMRYVVGSKCLDMSLCTCSQCCIMSHNSFRRTLVHCVRCLRVSKKMIIDAVP